MIRLLFGTWPRRGLTLAVCLLSFAMGLTGALVVGGRRSPAAAAKVRNLPGIGPVERAFLPPEAEKPAEEQGPQDVTTYRDVRPLSAEEIVELIESMKQQRQQLTQRTAELTSEQKRLGIYREELTKEREQIELLREKVTGDWEKLRKAQAEFAKEVASVGVEEEGNLRKLAQQYEQMKPDKAASIVAQLDENRAAKVLFLMRERNVAKILESMDQAIAARLTEKMALMRQPQAPAVAEKKG